MKLRSQFSLMFLALSFLSISLVGVLAYQKGKQIIETETETVLKSTNEHKQMALERWILERERKLELLARGPFFSEEFPRELAAHDRSDPDHMARHRKIVQKHIGPYVGDGRFLELFVMAGRDGVVAISTDPKQEGKHFGDQRFFDEGRTDTFVQNVYYSMARQEPAMTVSTPIRDRKGDVVAVLAGRLNLKELSDLILEGTDIRRTLDTYLVNKFNFFVTEPRHGDEQIRKRTIHTKGVEAALKKTRGIGFYADYRGVPVIGAYRWLPGRELGLITEIDQAEAFSPIFNLQKNIVVVAFIAAVVSALVGWFLSVWVATPLRRLVVGTQEIGQGNLDVRVGTARKDEIGELSRAFDKMIRELRDTVVSRDELTAEVSVRKQAEAAVQENETRFRTLAEASPLGIFAIRLPEMRFSYVNPAMCDVFGYSKEDLIDERGPLELTHPDYHEATKKRVDAFLAGQIPSGPFTFVGTPRDGRELTCEVTIRLAKLGGVQTILGTLVDVTERHRYQDRIMREKQFSETVINSLPGVFYLFDKTELRFLRWNHNFEAVTGYSSAELAWMSPLDLFDETDGARVAERIGEVFEKGFSTVEAEFVTKEGDRIPFYFTGLKQTIDDTDYLVGVGIDITRLKAAQDALAESEGRFRRLTENAKDMIYRMSLPDGTYEYVSPAAKEIFGHPPEAFYRKPGLIKEVLHSDWTDYFADQWTRLLNGDMPRFYEYRIVDPDGSTKWINQRNVLVKDEAGAPIAIEGIVTDVTEVKRMTQEQIRMEKFSALGLVAAGVAHELNNPLMGVLNYSEYCQEELPEGSELQPVLKDIEHETRRCIDIVQNLLGVSRLDGAGAGMISEFNAKEVLNRVVRLMEHRTRSENVVVREEVDTELPPLRMDGNAFQQLCLNLFTNAIDAVASSEKKEVRLALRRDKADLVLSVLDTGCGISEKDRERIYDPFFTTKPPGKGTGLGLATSWRIVQSQGGRISCDSRPGEGTTMTAVFPIES